MKGKKKMKKRTKIALGIIVVLVLAGGCGRNREEENRKQVQEKSAEQKSTQNNQKSQNEKPDTEKENEQISEPVKKEKPAPAARPEASDTGIRPEFKAAMDEYVAFYEDYARFMKQMQENPSDLGLLMDMTEWIDRLDEMDQKLEALDQTKDELNTAELNYYIDCTARIYRLLSEASI